MFIFVQHFWAWIWIWPLCCIQKRVVFSWKLLPSDVEQCVKNISFIETLIWFSWWPLSIIKGKTRLQLWIRFLVFAFVWTKCVSRALEILQLQCLHQWKKRNVFCLLFAQQLFFTSSNELWLFFNWKIHTKRVKLLLISIFCIEIRMKNFHYSHIPINFGKSFNASRTN